jgi:hypothetical protein
MSDQAPQLVSIDGPEEDSFPVTITVRNLKGLESSITFDCIPRDSLEWAAEGDKLRARTVENAKAEQAKADKKTKSKAEGDQEPIAVEPIMAGRIKADVDLAMVIAKGWSVTNPFSAASLSKMEAKFPGAIRDLHDGYQKKIHGAREGN